MKNITFSLIAALTGQKNIIPIPVLYVRAFGSYEAAAMLAQLTYWTERLPPERDGWVYKTQEEWAEELYFTRRDMETARRALLTADVIEYSLRGIPAKGHYRVKQAELVTYLSELCAAPDCTNRTNLPVRSVQTSPSKNVQTNTEPTSELTPEINDASASRVAARPPTVSSDESPEGRVQGADNPPLSGPLPADHETVGADIQKPLPPTPLPSLSHFPSGTVVHPEPQTPLPDPPTSSTGHSLLDRMAQLQASGKEDTEAMKRAKQRKDKANRQHWAIRGSIENASEQAIFDMVGEQGYRYMLRLMKDIRTSADSILGWLKRRPALATVIGKLTDETYVVHLQAGIDKAKRHTSGWQASPLPWFFEAVLSEVPEEKRTATPNGNSRHEYKVRMDAAQTAQEVRSIIEEFKTRGQLETRMKRDEQRNLVRDKDGEPVYNSAEEEIMLVCEERGLSLTKLGEQ